MRRYIPIASWLTITVVLIFGSGWWVVQLNPLLVRTIPWMLARAAGLVAYVLLTVLVLVGLAMSQPVWQSRHQTLKRLMPWHRAGTLVFLAFLLTHILAIALDPYVAIGWAGAFIPFLSGYRTVFVAMGTLALYFVVVLAFTAQFSRPLFGIRWLTVHRFALITYGLSWVHAVWTGSDTRALEPLYAVSGLAVSLMVVVRYWDVRMSRRRSAPPEASLPAAAGKKGESL